MGRITIDDVLAQGRSLLLDPANGPTVVAPTGNVADNRLRDLRVPGKGAGIGTGGWLAGETGLPFGMLTATSPSKKWPETGRVWSDWDGWLHLALATDIDGFTDLRGWAYAWEDALDQWFPSNYRLGTLGLQGTLGDLWWKYLKSEIGVFDIQNRPFFGLVCRLQIHIVNPVNWAVGLSTLP